MKQNGIINQKEIYMNIMFHIYLFLCFLHFLDKILPSSLVHAIFHKSPSHCGCMETYRVCKRFVNRCTSSKLGLSMETKLVLVWAKWPEWLWLNVRHVHHEINWGFCPSFYFFFSVWSFFKVHQAWIPTNSPQADIRKDTRHIVSVNFPCFTLLSSVQFTLHL